MLLTKQSLLQRVPDLDVALRSNTDITLTLHGRITDGDLHTLAILDMFATPKTLQDGVNELTARTPGEYAWVELTGHIAALYERGILQDPTQQPAVLRPQSRSYDAPPVHLRMLSDYRRTASFQGAIRDTVTTDDIVVDIGTGTGVLAATAALAGAKHVYAIEESTMAKLAQQVFDKNGLTDRITLIEARSTQIELPEKASVLVSEMIGNDPLGEGVLATTRDAVQRLLTQDARLIPAVLRIYGLPACMPGETRDKRIFTQEVISQWRRSYGIDFSPLLEAGQPSDQHMLINTYDAGDWEYLSEPILLADIDLKTARSARIETSATVPITHAGLLNGILIYFELDLSKTVLFSLHPDKATQENHWLSRVWLPGMPLAVESGERIEITYRYETSGSVFDVRRQGSA